MKDRIGYPEFILEKPKLDELYKSVSEEEYFIQILNENCSENDFNFLFYL